MDHVKEKANDIFKIERIKKCIIRVPNKKCGNYKTKYTHIEKAAKIAGMSVSVADNNVEPNQEVTSDKKKSKKIRRRKRKKYSDYYSPEVIERFKKIAKRNRAKKLRERKKLKEEREKQKQLEKASKKRKKKPKKKPKKKTTRATYQTKYRNLEKACKILFLNDDKDLRYVTEDPALLKLHLNFILRRPCESLNAGICSLEIEKNGKIVRPKLFTKFKELYPYIYERWVHMIRSCHDKSYQFYQFIGAKGLYVAEPFLDSRIFCMWCLRNGLTSKLGMYKDYMRRKNPAVGYSYVNCCVIHEKDIHTGKSLKVVLDAIYLLKRYEEGHAKEVSYMTAYTRYYIYDFQIEDAINYNESFENKADRIKIGFSPANFYTSVADENSCTLSVFNSRVHYHYLNGKLELHPYEVIKKDFSITDAANMQGKLSYKQQWDRNKKNDKDSVYKNIPNLENLIRQEIGVYDDINSSSVYSNIGD